MEISVAPLPRVFSALSKATFLLNAASPDALPLEDNLPKPQCGLKLLHAFLPERNEVLLGAWFSSSCDETGTVME